MPLQPLPRRELERRHREQRVDDLTVARRKDEARVKDVDLAFRLEGGKRKLEFRGRHYGVAPIPWRHVRPLILLGARFDHLPAVPTARGEREWARVHREVSRWFKRLARPTDPLARLFWPFLRPLKDASHAEVATLMGFILMFLARDCGLSPEKVLPSIWLPNSPGSPTTSPPGATEKASPPATNVS